MLPVMLLPTEDRYITSMYKFYFTTGLIHVIISVLMLLDLLGISEFSYSNFNELSYIFLVYSMIFFIIPFLFLVPFLFKLIRYSRKNKWLSFPLVPWLLQVVFALLADYSSIFLLLAYFCFITYGILGFAAGLHGLRLVKLHENLTLNRD
jgi:hypothetical protein